MKYFELESKYNVTLKNFELKTINTEFLSYIFYQDPKKKTLDVCIRPIRHDEYDILGEIKWYGAWRKYCLFTIENVLFDTKCLKDIETFISNLMHERKGK